MVIGILTLCNRYFYLEAKRERKKRVCVCVPVCVYEKVYGCCVCVHAQVLICVCVWACVCMFACWHK